MKNNNRLDYTLIAEGYAEYTFIPVYLSRLSSQFDIQLVRSRLGFKGQKAGGSKVLQEAELVLKIAISKGNELMIVGLDLDAPDHESEQPVHRAKCKLLLDKMGKTYQQYSERIKYFVPVQAIEQWIAYQGYQVKLCKQFSPHSLESKHPNELKKLLYGEKFNGAIMEKIAEKVAERADFAQLAKQSRSFNHFHQQITAFLTRYTNNADS